MTEDNGSNQQPPWSFVTDAVAALDYASVAEAVEKIGKPTLLEKAWELYCTENG